MQIFFSFVFACLLMGAAPCWGAENNSPKHPVELSPEDRKVVAVMEILQLMDLAENLDMMKDMDTLIEEDQHESQSD